MNKTPVAILGATGMVGQRFVTLLANHPWFEVVAVAASAQSAGKSYRQAVGERWCLDEPMPSAVVNLPVFDVTADREKIVQQVRAVFSALNMEAADIRKLEEDYAAAGVMVVSNNSAHRWTEDVPMIIPEVNAAQLAMIAEQRRRRGWTTGAIVVKPNCSIQSYVPALTALAEFQPQQVLVSTYQAVSGAGKTLTTWPDMVDNVIPFIGGEEEKSEREPLKIWAQVTPHSFVLPNKPVISAQCVRVPVSNGHMTTVNVRFAHRPTAEQILHAWEAFGNPIAELGLPSSPMKVLHYFTEENRPQTKLDRMLEHGMGVALGRLRADTVLDWKFVALSHNTVRGAAGGAVLLGELLKAKHYFD
jgi:aspartate-semialdehyde dehydrogenase